MNFNFGDNKHHTLELLELLLPQLKILSTNILINGAEWLHGCLSIKAGEAAVVHSLESSLARSI